VAIGGSARKKNRYVHPFIRPFLPRSINQCFFDAEFKIWVGDKIRKLNKMSRTTRNNLNLETGRPEKTRDNKPRCECCCNPRRSKYGNKKEKLTIQERKEVG